MASAERSTAHQVQQQQQQQQQQILKCPRCNSSNTKFCYYNNYSLSQPRHFCKACKRYWTRGGTLRNVPVGGGCRKNKRIKTTLTTLDNNPNPNFNPNPNLDHSTSSNNILNPLYGLLQRNSKQPRFNTRYDLIQPQTSSFRLGFSSLDRGDPSVARAHNSLSLVTSSKVSGGFTSSYSDHMISSLLASSLQQQPIYVGFPPYGSVVNEVQIEGSPKISTNWNTSLDGENDNDDQIKALESSDPTSFLWTITGGDGGSEWHDPTSNISVHSLI